VHRIGHASACPKRTTAATLVNPAIGSRGMAMGPSAQGPGVALVGSWSHRSMCSITGTGSPGYWAAACAGVGVTQQPDQHPCGQL
jgi:hypothetical protein